MSKPKYKSVPGRKDGQVEVLVRRSVIERFGDPTVDFDSLTRLVGELGLSPERTRIKLFSGRWVGHEYHLRKFAKGGKAPFSNTIYSGVGLNGTVDLPHPTDLPREMQEELFTGARNAAMSKLVHNMLRASGIHGAVLQEREHELYQSHAGDIQFLNPSPEAR